MLLGDYAAGHRFVTERVHADDWSKALAGLKAPLGVHAILGNHDWWDDRPAAGRGRGPVVRPASRSSVSAFRSTRTTPSG